MFASYSNLSKELNNDISVGLMFVSFVLFFQSWIKTEKNIVFTNNLNTAWPTYILMSFSVPWAICYISSFT